MAVPSVAILGRANVGKSTLFNALCGHRIAIVDSEPGITRDRVVRKVDCNGITVELVDTGGVGMESAEEIADDVDMQIQTAIVEADLVLLVVDARQGIHPLDRRIARRLRQAEKGVMVVANKAERPVDEQASAEFYELGFGRPSIVSAEQREGLFDLRQRLVEKLPEGAGEEESADEPLKLAIVGKRNAGKSTLINFLAQENRVVVSEMAGTTRDSVDVRFRFGNGPDSREFVAIDTAGVRKQKQLRESVDFYSQVRTERSIRRADVVLLMIDATTEITRVDKQLASQVVDKYKPCMVALNKIDLVPEDVPDEEFTRYVWWQMPGLRFAPLVMMSAVTGENVMPMLQVTRKLYAQAGARVQTSELNDVMEQITARRHPPSPDKRPGKVFYATQVEVHPPTIALFVNDAADIDDEYRRYLSNQLRDRLVYGDVPIRFVTRRRGKAAESAGGA
ncbi:MAG: ribosome biogenesis GTPase Der [Planctomycetota bacterium]